METFSSVITVYSELIMIKLISSWTAQRIVSLFSEEPAKEEGSESHKQNAAGMKSWTNKNILKGMTVPFIELC